MDGSDLNLRAEAYAATQGLQLRECLGSGIDGNVWKVMSKQNRFAWAIKMHRRKATYERERDCYKRLAALGVEEVLTCSVPQLIRADDLWQVIEMTIVERPFVLDFAGAYLDLPPDFPEEVWAEREAHWREHYGDDWPLVSKVKDAFEAMGIYLTDLHRNNIAPV